MVQPGTSKKPAKITEDNVRAATPHRSLPYDKNKDMHYDVISAFIKSMRGSDPDAALYWLARMIDGGEDPKFIARRMFIAASEDIGNADPQALLIAEAAFKSAEVIGYPECRINLAQAAIYLALAPKSNAAEAGIDAALNEVRNGRLATCPTICAIGTAPDPRTTASTSIRTATQRLGEPALPARRFGARLLLPVERSRLGGLPQRHVRARPSGFRRKPHVARKVTDCLLLWKQGEKLTSACISSKVLVL